MSLQSSYVTDFLLFFAGPNIYSPSLAVLSGDLSVPFNMSTTGHQLFLRWSSDHGTNKKGFRITYVGEYQSMYPRSVIPLVFCVSLVTFCLSSPWHQRPRVRPFVLVFVSECFCIYMFPCISEEVYLCQKLFDQNIECVWVVWGLF